MRYLRLFSVLVLSTFAITGCHRRQEQVVPPPQAQAPIVTTLPPVPPLTFPNVQLGNPKPAPRVVHTAPPPPPRKPPVEKAHRRRVPRKPKSDTTTTPTTSASGSSSPPAATSDAATSTPPAAPASSASLLGQLSADDATINPRQNAQTQRLIQHTEIRLRRISRTQQAQHKDAIAQVSSFLTQAKQAWAMNDIVGAETLANKAKILLDELLK